MAKYELMGSVMDDLAGLDDFSPIARERSLRYEQRINECAQLWFDVIERGKDPFWLRQATQPTSSGAYSQLCREYPHLFTEAMSTSDFKILTQDVLDRELLGYYKQVPIPNLGLVRPKTLNDFRNRRLYIYDGMTTRFDKLGEHEVHKQRAFAEQTPIDYYPDVYAAGAKVTWRALINDDLGLFKEIPNRLAIGAARTKHYFISTLYVDANGPHASLYTAGAKNIINITNGASKNNPKLDAAGLSDAFAVMMNQVDAGGDPILIPGNLYLVVGPALFTTAKNLMNMLTVDVSIEGGTTNTQGFGTRVLRVNNWMVGGLTLVLDPYMRQITTASGTKDTQWLLFADPTMQERPALELGSLRGYDTPQLFMKAPNTMRVGGGLDPAMGDFYSMATEYKSVLAFGGTRVDGKATVSSTGQEV